MEREYVLHLAAFFDVYSIDIGVSLDDLLAADDTVFAEKFNIVKDKVRLIAIKSALAHNRRKKSGEVAVYVLSPAQKTRIHKSIDEIRAVLAGASLPENKRDALVNRLNAFAAEVDRNRTRLEALSAIYVGAKREVAEALPLLEKIFDVFAKAKEALEPLPSPKKPAQLPAPEQEEGMVPEVNGSAEDEVPF